MKIKIHSKRQRQRQIQKRYSIAGDKTTKICGAAKIKCYSGVERKFRSSGGAKQYRDKCHCLPACTSIDYNVNIGRLPVQKDEISDSIFKMTEISVFYGDYQVKTVKRNETYTISDFLAIVGGVLGLFMGVSALSIIEIIYFCTLRLCFKFRRGKTETTTVSSDQQRDSRFFRIVRLGLPFFKEFCKKSNIHGVRYFTEQKRKWIERFAIY